MFSKESTLNGRSKLRRIYSIEIINPVKRVYIIEEIHLAERIYFLKKV